VIANAKSDVVRWHCERSAAGVPYDDEDQLVECLRFCVDEPELAARMGSRGRDYVLSHYLWPDVVDRIEELIVERLR
jgi:glycosyltransferase involved in cell wall biosynthesis